mmetsp:Transcript_31265/g.47847  ORF Transcript_31265/g.47847 Transcript_31265/m.47847 type:complete len:362 (-) Transcript_31265:454-1539(-)
MSIMGLFERLEVLAGTVLLIELMEVVLVVGISTVAESLLLETDEGLREGAHRDLVVVFAQVELLLLVCSELGSSFSSVNERNMRGRNKLRGIILNVVIEDLRSTVHAVLERLVLREREGLLRLQVASDDELFLELEKLEADILVLRKELMLVGSRLKVEVLASQALKVALHVHLEVLQVGGGLDQATHSFLELSDVVIGLNAHVGEDVGLFSLPLKKGVEVLLEFGVALEAIVDVVSRDEVKISSVNGLVEGQGIAEEFLSILALLEHELELLNSLLDNFNILVADVSELARGLSQEVVVEIQLVGKGGLDMASEHLHPPGNVKFSQSVVIIGSSEGSLASQSHLDLVESGGQQRSVESLL